MKKSEVKKRDARKRLFERAVTLISAGLTDGEFDGFWLALDGDARMTFEAAVEVENQRRNPKKYVHREQV